MVNGVSQIEQEAGSHGLKPSLIIDVFGAWCRCAVLALFAFLAFFAKGLT